MMDDQGYMRRMVIGDDIPSKNEVIIPQDIMEAAVNMTRAERRRQYRLLKKAERRADKAAQRRG